MDETPFTIAAGMLRKKFGETSFGERLVAIRKARGLTQVQLAEAAGTTQQAVSYYETEAGFPPAPAVIQLAKALQVSTDELQGLRAPKVERVNGDAAAAEEIPTGYQLAREEPESGDQAHKFTGFRRWPSSFESHRVDCYTLGDAAC